MNNRSRRGGVVPGIISCTGAKFQYTKPSKKFKAIKNKVPVMNYTERADVLVIEEPKVDRPAFTEDQFKEVILDAYARHLKRACGDYAQALDMTYYFLKHMKYAEEEWVFMQKIMAIMKEEL